ncbi:GntR family transcriptional regulator [Paenibacillus xerothermodurans]|uniref:GntR family transcriptional regulator n=1 Tax=Paenibacillus xerothermodurans TaxID=1977292 RepID=A0A2W1ND86_PAEXE|nr:GntR family transcriptional regulator [Paenibacillus xerothermodurans]PZE21580.1 GntR family transcriptional regulator [Paenibacillus xerothermodurans]
MVRQMNAGPLYKQIYDYIIEQVKNGELEAGDRIPSEKELAEHFQVSRITSKKALDLLSQHSIIHRIQGKGSFLSKQEFLSPQPAHEFVEPKQGHLLGIIFPDLGDSYGSGIVRAIEAQCNQSGSHLMIKLSHGSSTIEELAISQLIEIGVEGLIVFPVSGRHYNPKILELVVKNYPLVLVDRYLRDIPASSVCTHNRAAATAATNYLFSLGHERIGFISRRPEGTSAIEERMQGFHMAYAQKAIQLDPQLFLTTIAEDDLDASIGAIQDFIVSNADVTAFIACEYGVALILQYALEAVGKSIPQDYAVICFDSPPCVLGKPFFTHIRQNEVGIGEKAMDLLLLQLGGNTAPQNTLVDFTLVEGQSTRANKLTASQYSQIPFSGQ